VTGNLAKNKISSRQNMNSPKN